MSDEGIVKYKPNWNETRERFEAWWNHSHIGRPMFNLSCPREEPLGETIPLAKDQDPEYYHTNVDHHVNAMLNRLYTTDYIAEAFPNCNINLGAGSLAIYLGSEPIFAESTIWFKEVVEDWKEWDPLTFDPENKWFRKHLEWTKEMVQRADGRFLVNIPDIIENADILSALRGPQTFCFDLIDEPELMHRLLDQLDVAYFEAYDRFYDIVKAADGSSSFTAFQVWGEGKTAKVQCDHAALMSPGQWREFVQPSLRRQCDKLNHSVYHLDGKDAICHVDALMEIDSLDALQWTAGAGQPDGGEDCWFPIYDKVRDAGKSLHISTGGTPAQIAAKVDAIVKRYGPDGLYFLIGGMERADAIAFLEKAEQDWSANRRRHCPACR